MKIVKRILPTISLLNFYLMQAKPVYASDGILNGASIIADGPKDIWAGVKNTDQAWNSMYGFTGTLIAGITGLISIIMVGIFAYKAFELSRSSGNPAERQKAIQGLIYSGAAFAVLGGASTFIGIFYGLLK